MNFLLAISTILSAIKDVEAFMPSSAGVDKFKAVIVLVEDVLGSVTQELPAITAFINARVAAYNASGLFKKKAA